MPLVAVLPPAARTSGPGTRRPAPVQGDMRTGRAHDGVAILTTGTIGVLAVAGIVASARRGETGLLSLFALVLAKSLVTHA